MGEPLLSSVRDESWKEKNAAQARGLYRNQGLHTLATLMASTHPWAIDYLKQAPILVLCVSNGTPRRHKERLWVAMQIGAKCERKDRLRKVLDDYGIPYQLRAISGHALAPSRRRVLMRLGKIAPSTLAQIIPEKVGQQDLWLRALSGWVSQIERRWRFRDPWRGFEWAACAFTDPPRDAERVARDLADFYADDSTRWVEAWTLSQARTAMERWHAELARRDQSAGFFKKHGVAFGEQIDYRPFPDSYLLDGFDFVALRTGEDLFVDGAAMHHCVSTYAPQVIIGMSRIFSVRKGERRVATLELGLNANGPGYQVRQISGPCNSSVTKEVWAICEKYTRMQTEFAIPEHFDPVVGGGNGL